MIALVKSENILFHLNSKHELIEKMESMEKFYHQGNSQKQISHYLQA
ncbi:hypothetical protein IFVP408_C2150002 [Vibrio parahaemolyticus]